MRPTLAILLLLAPAAVPAAEAEAGPPIIELQAETLVIGAGGTRAVGHDRALLSPGGRAGLLRLRVPIAPPEGTLVVELRVRLGDWGTEGAAAAAASPDDRAGVVLQVDSTARPEGTAEAVLRSSSTWLAVPSSQLYEVFVSPVSGERAVVHLELQRWTRPAAEQGNRPAPSPVPVAYRVYLNRVLPGGLDHLGSLALHSLVGHAASYEFGFLLPDPEGAAPTQEVIQVEVLAAEVRDGVLTGRLRLHGIVRGRPVDRSRSWSVRSGEEAAMQLDLGEVADEDLGFQVLLVAAFREPSPVPARERGGPGGS